jgi:RHS repeat-associated protein
VSADPSNHNGVVSYTYDSVGNRKTLTSTLAPVGANTYNYDTDDRLAADQYDADGNTVSSLGTANTYDFENHLITHGAVTVVYDGDGNRVSETVGGVTTNYLVDTQNPTGYAQVVDELQSGTVSKTYSYGLERIDQTWQPTAGNWQLAFYGYDGHGSVRQLTNSAGAVTDRYDYDAFGNLISSTGSTPNNYLFAGEQYDPALGLYYNRARYLNASTGRFWSMDIQQGSDRDPLSLHKYLYAGNDPVGRIDPSGSDYIDAVVSLGIQNTLSAMSTTLLNSPLGSSVQSFVASLFIPSWVSQGLANKTPDAAVVGIAGQVNLNLNNSFVGGAVFGGFEALGSLKTGYAALYRYFGGGITTGTTTTSGGVSGYVGLVFDCPSSQDYTQYFGSVTVPQGALGSRIIAKLLGEMMPADLSSISGDIPALLAWG